MVNTLVRKEIEIETKEGNWYSMRILPYRTTENMIDGIVVTFVDITKLKIAENKLIRANEFSKTVLKRWK